jgi:hypothetical protein
MHALLLTLSVVAQVPASGPASLHYKYESKNVTTVEVMGQTQDVPVEIFALLTTTMSDTTGGKIAHVVIDSVVFDDHGAMEQSLAMMPPETAALMTASGKGAFFHLYLVDGKPRGAISPSAASVQSGSAGGAIPLIFPGLRPTAKTGDSWSDTTVTDTVLMNGAGHGKTTAVMHWVVTSKGPDEAVLDGTVTTSATIDVGNGMGQMLLQSTGTQHVRLGADGAAREAASSLTMSGTMTMAMGDMTVKGTVTSTLTLIP